MDILWVINSEISCESNWVNQFKYTEVFLMVRNGSILCCFYFVITQTRWNMCNVHEYHSAFRSIYTPVQCYRDDFWMTFVYMEYVCLCVCTCTRSTPSTHTLVGCSAHDISWYVDRQWRFTETINSCRTRFKALTSCWVDAAKEVFLRIFTSRHEQFIVTDWEEPYRNLIQPVSCGLANVNLGNGRGQGGQYGSASTADVVMTIMIMIVKSLGESYRSLASNLPWLSWWVSGRLLAKVASSIKILLAKRAVLREGSLWAHDLSSDGMDQEKNQQGQPLPFREPYIISRTGHRGYPRIPSSPCESVFQRQVTSAIRCWWAGRSLTWGSVAWTLSAVAPGYSM